MSDVDSVVKDGMRKQWRTRIGDVLGNAFVPMTSIAIAEHLGETDTNGKTQVAAALHDMTVNGKVFRKRDENDRWVYSLRPLDDVTVRENSQGGTVVTTPASAKRHAESLFMPPPRSPLGAPFEAYPAASMESGAGTAERTVPATQFCAASAHEFWCAISSDGALQINAAAGALKLAAHELQALARFLERASLLIETLDRSGP